MDSTPCDYAHALLRCERPAHYDVVRDRHLCLRHAVLRDLLDKDALDARNLLDIPA